MQFGDQASEVHSSNFSKSAYINKKVFGANLKNETKTIISSSQNKLSSVDTIDNAGAMVTWDTIDEKDNDFRLDDVEPSLEYMSWGVWAMASSDGQEYDRIQQVQFIWGHGLQEIYSM